MDKADDRESPSKPIRKPHAAEASSGGASGASREREARLSAALRANLRRRKVAPVRGD